MEIHNLPDPILSAFSNGNWKRALALFCEEREKKAIDNLIGTEPTNACAVARFQEEIRQLRKLSCIERAVIKFEEKEAASKLTK